MPVRENALQCLPATRRRPALHGFTLIELLVVIAILAILIALLTPSLKVAKALGEQARCFGMEHNQMLALQQYLTDFDGRFPVYAVYYCYSPRNWGPKDAWFVRNRPPDEYWHEGIGDYLGGTGSDYQCKAAAEYENLHSWGLSAYLPTYVPNRTVIPYDPGPDRDMPAWYRCAQKVDRITKAQQCWVFADGNWRGVFQAFSLSYESTFERFFWSPHMGGTNVAYLDGHAAWVSEDKNIHPDDWPSHYNPSLEWCAMTCWHTMWK